MKGDSVHIGSAQPRTKGGHDHGGGGGGGHGGGARGHHGAGQFELLNTRCIVSK